MSPTKNILFFLSITAILIHTSLSAEDLERKKHSLTIHNQTPYDLYINFPNDKFEYIKSSWTCPVSTKPSLSPTEFNPLPSQKSATGSWDCYKPMAINLGAIGDTKRIDFQGCTWGTKTLYFVKGNYGTELKIEIECWDTPSKPYEADSIFFYHRTITITEVKAYKDRKDWGDIKEPTNYLTTGVSKVNVENKTKYPLWITLEATEEKSDGTHHPEHFSLAKNGGKGSTKSGNFHYASEGSLFHIGGIPGIKDPEQKQQSAEVGYGYPISMSFSNPDKDLYIDINIKFEYNSATGEVNATISEG